MSTVTDNDSPRNARLCIRDVTKSYNSAPVLISISLTVEPSETVAVMGPSGSGKSTLLHCMSGVLLLGDGDVISGGTKVNSLSDASRSALRLHDFNFVFRDGQLPSELTAKENVTLPMTLRGKKHSKLLELANDVLNRLGLTDLTHRRPGQMSGGQAQRVAIVRAMAGEPGVIFADKPTGALDQSTGHGVIQQLTALMEQTGMTLVMVTHDVKVANWCRRRMEIRDGLIHDDHMLAGAEVTK